MDKKTKKVNEIKKANLKVDHDEIEMMKRPEDCCADAEVLVERMNQRELHHKRKWVDQKASIVSQTHVNSFQPKTNAKSARMVYGSQSEKKVHPMHAINRMHEKAE